MKKLVLTIAVAAIALSANAQPRTGFDQDLGTYERVTKRGPYLTNRFGDNWFIGLAGGVNMYLGNGDEEGDIAKRLAPAAEISLGKWFTPSVGLRFQYSGIQAKGFSYNQSLYTSATPDGNDLYEQKFNTMFIHADLLWNISNAFGGYKNTRTWNFVLYGGAGYARSYKDDYNQNQIAATAGLLNNIRLGGVVDLTLDARYMAVKENFDGDGRGNKFEGMATVTAGLTFKLGPKGGFKRPIFVAPADYTPYQNRINNLEGDLAAERARAERLARELDDCLSKETGVEQVFTPVTISSFFGIGNAQVSERDMINLSAVATTMNKTPDRQFTVTGYADSATGSERRNQELSTQRAENVANILVDQFGVNRSQLTVTGAGGVNRHSNPALDRIVIIE